MQALAGAGHGVGAAGCGQEVALALLHSHGLAAAGQGAFAIGDEQRDEALLVRHALKGAVSGIHREILTLGQMSAKIMLYRRGAQGHIQRLFHMQGSGLAVGTDAAVVVNAVGHVGVLLYLGHHDALADGMQRARRDIKTIPLVHRHGVQNLRQGVVFDALGKFLFADLMVKFLVQ